MIGHDLLYGYRHLGKDAGRRLQVGARVVAHQVLDGLVVVLHLCHLQHFLGTRDGDGVYYGAVVSLHVAEDVQLGEFHVGHAAYARLGLQVESRADIVDELLRVLEILGMVEICTEHVGSVIVVSDAVLVGIGVVYLNADIGGKILRGIVQRRILPPISALRYRR